MVKSLIFTGFNPNGAKTVYETFSAIVTMQETKVSQTRRIKLDGYFTFERVRSNKDGEGVAISAHKTTKPAL